MDYYQILGVHRDASSHAIKQAYRRLAKRYHPDLNPQNPDRAKHQFQIISQAYAILSDTSARREYDEHHGAANRRQQDRRTESQDIETERRTHERRARDEHADWERRARELMEEERRSRRQIGNRFESKDAFLAAILCFFFLLQNPIHYWSKVGNVILAWPFFVFAIALALFCKIWLARIYSRIFRREEDSFGEFAITVLAGALAFEVLASALEVILHQSLFIRPLSPALIAASIGGTFGAGLGRAFNRALGVPAGLAGGAFAGAAASILAALGVIVAKIAELGGDIAFAQFGTFAHPAAAAVLAGTLTGAIGSYRLRRVFLYSALEWLEERLSSSR